MGLNNYLNDTMQLLRDTNYSFVTQQQMVRWVNSARREAAERSGCIRRLITGQSPFGAAAQPGIMVPGAFQPGSLPAVGGSIVSSGSGGGFSAGFSSGFSIGGTTGSTVPSSVVQNACQTIPGVERYPYQGFFNPFLRAAYAGCDSVIDTIACSVNWGGVNRPSLDWMPFEDFQAYARAYAVLNTSYPSVWSVFNDGPDGEIFMFPVPSQAGEIELDVFAVPNDLYADTDPDAIPHVFQRAIKFGAAKLQFMASSRWSQADMMEAMFADALGVARVSVDRGKVPSFYR